MRGDDITLELVMAPEVVEPYIREKILEFLGAYGILETIAYTEPPEGVKIGATDKHAFFEEDLARLFRDDDDPCRNVADFIAMWEAQAIRQIVSTRDAVIHVGIAIEPKWQIVRLRDNRLEHSTRFIYKLTS